MFYTTINIVVINSFLLSLHVPVAKEDKFTKYIVFREALYRGLFNHIIGIAGVDGADISSLAESLNTAEILSLPTTEGTGGAGIKHQRIGIKRGLYVICKQATSRNTEPTLQACG